MPTSADFTAMYDAHAAELLRYVWRRRALGVPVGTVRSRLSRARRRLGRLTEPRSSKEHRHEPA